MKYKIFDGFVREEQVSHEVIDQYVGRIPIALIEVWKQFGFGTVLGGYLKIINPDAFQDVVKASYFRNEVAIPILATGMGDVIVWEENRYLRLVNYRRGIFKGISAGFKFFFSDLESDSFREKYVDWAPYPEAVRNYGEPKFDECFGYVPILGLGGPEKVENLKKMKLIEHIYLITQFMGPVA